MLPARAFGSNPQTCAECRVKCAPISSGPDEPGLTAPLGPVKPYRLRHYFGVTSAMAGVPTTALMRAMGHRTPIMTARYSEFADAERRWAFARADITNGIRLPTTR